MDVEPAAMKSADEHQTFTVLVTGANSGLGLGICCRLIDEFLFTRPQSQSLHILYSTRDVKKSEATSKLLHAHLQKTLRQANAQLKGSSLLLEGRVKIEGVLCDLTELKTLKALAESLLRRGQKLDAIVWNAGIGGWIGPQWATATYKILTDLIHTTIYPEWMTGTVGDVIKPQTNEPNEPKLGKVFTSNLFGHYLLTHWLMPLFDVNSRIVCIGSITTCTFGCFNLDDLQGLLTDRSYESSKRLTDLLALTADLPSTRPYTKSYFSISGSNGKTKSLPDSSKPNMYMTHPGICGTSIGGMNSFMAFWMFVVFYLARWLGSPWHPITPYKGAVSACFAVLAPPGQLDEREQREGKGKWGSTTGVFGDERVARTDCEGWGYCGQVGKVPHNSITMTKGRDRNMRSTNQEMREEFEDQGRKAWQAMESLRKDWQQRLGAVKIEDAEDL